MHNRLFNRSLLISGATVSLMAGLLLAQAPTKPAEEKKTVTKSGLTIIEKGSGASAAVEAGDTVWVHYTGRLENGTEFDSSSKHRETSRDGISFTIGAGQVIKGWDEGITGMKLGEKRQLIIPPELGYGAAGAGATIPPNATLIFDVELIGLKKAPKR
jgi:peptidylprolyl isomerase